MTAQLLALLLACGTEDWAAKTLTDGKPVAESGLLETVQVMRALHPAPSIKHVLVWMTAYVIAWKLEEDGDFHVVVADTSGGPTMIVELADPECAMNSPRLDSIKLVRDDFVRLFGQPGPVGRLKTLKKPVKVQFSGVVYFDHLHGQTGVAPNGVEIHPALSIELEPE